MIMAMMVMVMALSNNQLPIVESKLIESSNNMQIDIVTEDNYLTAINNDNYKMTDVDFEYISEPRVDCDPTSMETYYQFDYYAYTLIIYCVTLIGLIANVIFIVFLLQSDNDNGQVLELLMLLSVFQHGQTFFVAILFLSTKPIKRLTKNIWQRCQVRCQLMKQNIKQKVEDDDDDTFAGDIDHDTNIQNDINYYDGFSPFGGIHGNINQSDKITKKRKIEEKYKSAAKIVKLPRQFYHRLPVLW